MKRNSANADAPNRSAQNAASRKLAALSSLLGRTEAVSRAANGLDQVGSDLGAQPAHVGLDHAGLRIEMEVPHLLEQHCARHHAPGVAQEVLEQLEFLRLEIDAAGASLHRALEQVHLQIGEAQDRFQGA